MSLKPMWLACGARGSQSRKSPAELVAPMVERRPNGPTIGRRVGSDFASLHSSYWLRCSRWVPVVQRGLRGIAQFWWGLGSSVAHMLNLDPRACRILLLSGAAGGTGAIFRAPLGGALFAAEVVYRGPDFEGLAVFPGVITAIVSYSAFSILMGKESLFRTSELTFSRPVELPFYGLLGLLCAAVGILYVRTFCRGERMLRGIFRPPPLRAAAGR